MKLTQDQFMRDFNDKFREQFNPIFFQRSNQEIMDCMKKVILSCERDKYYTLKVLGMKEIYGYEEINSILKKYEDDNRRKNSPENPYDFINIKDSDLMILEVTYLIRHNGSEIQEVGNGETEVVLNPYEIITIPIALPRFSRKYYLRLAGNYYSDIFQIVDGSTYNNAVLGQKTKKAPCTSFKTIFTPVRIFKMTKKMTDYISNSVILTTCYTSIIPLVYNTHLNCMYYILANYGFYGAMIFLNIDCVTINKEPIMDDNFFNFEKNGIFISYPKVCAKDGMVQSFAATLYDGIKSDTTFDDMFDHHHWLKVLGKCFNNESVDKGLFILDSLDGIYDIITREQIHLPDNEKHDIYQILRWMMREFNELQIKNNVDISLKRYRIGEPIVAQYAAKLIMGILRISDMGKKVTLKSVKRAINIKPTYIIDHIVNKNNLVSYRDMVNDNDAMTALKWTFKGISGLGENGTNIQQVYRFVDPSHAGIVDLDSSTTSDPGMTGTLCPLGKVYKGNSFSDYEEPMTWDKEFRHVQTDFYNENYKEPVEVLDFEGDNQYDLKASRRRIVNESIQIDIPQCPLDSSVGEDLTIFAEEYERVRQEQEQRRTRFTIVEDVEDE